MGQSLCTNHVQHIHKNQIYFSIKISKFIEKRKKGRQAAVYQSTIRAYPIYFFNRWRFIFFSAPMCSWPGNELDKTSQRQSSITYLLFLTNSRRATHAAIILVARSGTVRESERCAAVRRYITMHSLHTTHAFFSCPIFLSIRLILLVK